MNDSKSSSEKLSGVEEAVAQPGSSTPARHEALKTASPLTAAPVDESNVMMDANPSVVNLFAVPKKFAVIDPSSSITRGFVPSVVGPLGQAEGSKKKQQTLVAST